MCAFLSLINVTLCFENRSKNLHIDFWRREALIYKVSLVLRYDLYPKAKIHLLILPRNANVQHIGKLDPKNEDDVKLLQKMVARTIY